MLSARVIRKKKMDYPAAFRRINARFLEAAGTFVEGEAKARAPRDRSLLINSLNYRTTRDQAIVGTAAEYAPHVEYGTRPHFPPIKAIREWAGRVLGDEGAAFPVARAIAKKGTKAQPFLRPALDENRKRLVKMYHDTIRKVFGGR
jgi:phage gpG-like protein